MTRVAAATFALAIAASLSGCHKYVDTQRVSEIESPDRQNVITVDLIQYGNSFGPLLYRVRIGPRTEHANGAGWQDLIEIDDTGSTPPPAIRWTGNSAVIMLPVKPGALSEAVQRGLKAGPAADHFRNVHITYRSAE
ncbi:MAG: hypothetical protein ABI963_13025 [Rhizomicrobium sp.]